jgi:mono/diheme cytochrome c family protein
MKKIKYPLLIAVLLSGIIVKASPVEEGRTLFMTRCAGCHNVNRKLTGPPLAGVDQRRSIDWIIAFVHSSRTMIDGGDKDAVALFEKYGRTSMPDHTDLTKDNILQIVEYIKSEVKPEEANSAPFARPGKRPDPSRPLSAKDYGFFGIYLFAVGILIAVLLLGVKVREIQEAKMKTTV